MSGAGATQLARRDDLVRLFGTGVDKRTDDGQRVLEVTRGGHEAKLSWRPTAGIETTRALAISASTADGWPVDATFELLKEFDYALLWPTGFVLVARPDVPIPRPWEAKHVTFVASANGITDDLNSTPGYVAMMAVR